MALELRFEQEGFITQVYYLKCGIYALNFIDWVFVLPGIFDQFFVNHWHYKDIVHVQLREKSSGK
jgi:hypothetical protein